MEVDTQIEREVNSLPGTMMCTLNLEMDKTRVRERRTQESVLNDAEVLLVGAVSRALIELGYGWTLEWIHGGDEELIGVRFTTATNIPNWPAAEFTVFTADYAHTHPELELLFVEQYEDWKHLVEMLPVPQLPAQR